MLCAYWSEAGNSCLPMYMTRWILLWRSKSLMIRQRLCWQWSDSTSVDQPADTHTANWSDTNKQRLATLICSWTVADLLLIECASSPAMFARSPISTDSDMLVGYLTLCIYNNGLWNNSRHQADLSCLCACVAGRRWCRDTMLYAVLNQCLKKKKKSGIRTQNSNNHSKQGFIYQWCFLLLNHSKIISLAFTQIARPGYRLQARRSVSDW